MKLPRRTETGEAPAWQGATTENTGSIRRRSNEARGDASPVECSGSFTTDSYYDERSDRATRPMPPNNSPSMTSVLNRDVWRK